MPNKNLNKTKKRLKADTKIVKGTVTKMQKEIIQKLIGILGSNEQDVVGKILTIWLYTEGYLKDLKKKESGD